MARTRSTKAAPADSKTSTKSQSTNASSKITLPPQSENPSKIFILPSKATSDARIVTLPNPRHSRPSRYLACPETGIYEFTKVAASKTTPHSWLIETPSPSEASAETDSNVSPKQASISTGQELYLATPLDPLFLCLPALADAKSSKASSDQKRMFLSSDDHFEKLPEAPHLSEIMRWPKTRALIERRMGAICDTVEAGDEIMFRLDEKKLLSAILDKAAKMSDGGLPPSMDDKFVKKALEAPILIQKREMNRGEVVTTSPTDSQATTPLVESAESQTTSASTETAVSSASQPSTAATSFTEEPNVSDDVVSAMQASPEVIKLQRLRVAFNFICANYVASALAAQLQEVLAKAGATSVDFSPLDDYLASLSKLRAEALAIRSVGDYTRKHGRDEEDDEARAEKKKRMEEEKKKKASESRGVRELKKVNTKGMKKMSDFFKKKA